MFSSVAGRFGNQGQTDYAAANDLLCKISSSLRRLLVVPTDAGYRIETESGAHHVEREDGVVVRAGWPALVVAVHVRPGARVAAGDPIAVLESMKMETTVTAPADGEVVSVAVGVNVQVEAGAPLLRLRLAAAGAQSVTCLLYTSRCV